MSKPRCWVLGAVVENTNDSNRAFFDKVQFCFKARLTERADPKTNSPVQILLIVRQIRVFESLTVIAVDFNTFARIFLPVLEELQYGNLDWLGRVADCVQVVAVAQGLSDAPTAFQMFYLVTSQPSQVGQGSKFTLVLPIGA